MIQAPSGFAALCAILIAACTLAPEAVAQRSTQLEAADERMSEQEAVAWLKDFFSKRPRVKYGQCGIIATEGPITSFEVTAASARITFCSKQVRDLVFEKLPVVRTCADMNCRINHGMKGICVGPATADPYHWCLGGETILDVPDPQKFANAWLALAYPPPRDPATDAAFQAALQAARSSSADRTEANRRTQVQVEALLAANRRDEAVSSYREALAASPDWADGHYNLALVAGEMGNHVEAITAMKRYLYLKPDSPDARAATDQIYRWEALLPASRRP